MRDCLVFAPTQLPLESLGQNSSSLPFIGPGSVFPEKGEKRGGGGGGGSILEVFGTIYLDGSLPLGIVISPDLYPQTKVGDILDSGPSRRRRRRRNFLVDAITQKQINIFFSNLVHMLRVPKGRSLF